MIDNQVDFHPDFSQLLERYLIDSRFIGREPERVQCINYLLDLNNWVQRLNMPPAIQAVLLAGSFSSLKPEIPDLSPVKRGPWMYGTREGGSDLDVLFLYSSDILGLLKLHWLDFNVPERELVHPDDFVINARDNLTDQLYDNCSPDLISRVHLHVVVLTPTLGTLALKKYARHMIQTGTLIWGNLELSDYGKFRLNPPIIKRPKSDPIIDRMAGGF